MEDCLGDETPDVVKDCVGFVEDCLGVEDDCEFDVVPAIVDVDIPAVVALPVVIDCPDVEYITVDD